MKEVLFKGKRIDNGEWAEGDLIKHGNDCFVIPFFGISNTEEQENKTCDTLIYLQAHKVDPHNVWQYSGVTDKNGKKIFEGDIVAAPFIGHLNKTEIRKGIVAFMNGAFSVSWKDEMYGRSFVGYVEDIEVIGNLYDNPELI